MRFKISVILLIIVQILNSYKIETFSFKSHPFYSIDLTDNQTESNFFL